MSEESQLNSKYQQLLRDLKTTVEGLLNSQVANVWDIYGGLNRLHVDVEKIFKHGCKISSNNSNSDYWQFIQGLEWLQPDSSNSTYILDCECKAHIPQNIKNDKASIWLYRSLESHSLSQKLSWLLSDKTHLLSCYQTMGFLCQDMYAEATLICLRAVERNQPSLISEIKPNLFLLSTSAKEYYKMHRRCSSFPDSHLKNIKEKGLLQNTAHSFDFGLKSCQENNENIDQKVTQKKIIKGKLRTWNSCPNIGNHNELKVRNRSSTVIQSHTTPPTPNHISQNNLQPTSLNRSLQKGKKTSLKTSDSVPKKTVRHVIINNCDIIEHRAPSNHMKNTSSSLVSSSKSLAKSPTRNLGSSAPEYSFLSSLSGISGEKDFKKQPKKTFIEDGGMSVLPMATGYFPRPMKGQTLTSFLMSSQFTRATAELDRENAHFSISEAVISAMEQIKCKRDLRISEDQQEDSDEEINNLKQRIRLRRKQKLEEKERKVFGSSFSDGRTDTTTEASPASISSSPGTFSASISSEDVDDLEIDEASNLFDTHRLSMSMASLYSEADVMKRPRGAPDGASDILSAEGVALSLISRFSEKQLPRASDLEWLVSEEDAPQALLPLPKSWPVSPDDGNQIAAMSLRGTSEWAPPRAQIIFTIHPSASRKTMLEKQSYRCAGCGMRVAQQYASKFRYCNYLGRFFCTGCHANQLSMIPARMIQKWNFTRYPVSTFSYRLLEQMYTDPLFRIFDLNKSIAKQSRNLQICRKYRLGLSYLKDFILTCRFADIIQDYLKSLPLYIYNDPDIYSMEDLVNIKTGEMKSTLQYIVETCGRHTAKCELCLARGFICEICHSNEIIFPWQMRTVKRCSKCGCCFHIKCWKNNEPCSRCRRFIKRRESSCGTVQM